MQPYLITLDQLYCFIITVRKFYLVISLVNLLFKCAYMLFGSYTFNKVSWFSCWKLSDASRIFTNFRVKKHMYTIERNMYFQWIYLTYNNYKFLYCIWEYLLELLFVVFILCKLLLLGILYFLFLKILIFLKYIASWFVAREELEGAAGKAKICRQCKMQDSVE